MRINLHIERLVLDGLPAAGGGAARVRAALEAELGRLLAGEAFAPARSSAHARAAGGEMPVRPGTSEHELGGAIGRSVFAGVVSSGSAHNHSTPTKNQGKTLCQHPK